jgi:regulatory protein
MAVFLYRDRPKSKAINIEWHSNESWEMGGRITALKAQKRNRQRVNVYIDDNFAFGLAAIEAMRLQIGQTLDDREIARLKERDQIEVAHERALNFLSYRPRSVAEVRRRLTEKGFDEAAIDQVVARLSRAGLLDDEAFAGYWIENRMTHRPRGRRALRYELRQKGVPDSVISHLLYDYDEADAAYRAGATRAEKLARSRSYDTDTLRSKLLAFLNRRGFSYEIARDTVNRILAELAEEGAETK